MKPVPLPSRNDDDLLDEAALRAIPPPEFLLEDRIPHAAVGMIYAPPGQGKTILVAGACGCVTRGSDWFRAPVLRPGPVVMNPAEDLPGWHERWFRWRADEGITDDETLQIHTFVGDLNLFTGAGYDAFARHVTRLEPSLVVLDTFAATTTGCDENSTCDTGIVLARCRRIVRKTPTTVLFLHHPTKDGSSLRGSSNLKASMDFVLTMEPTTRGVTLKSEKMRNAAPITPLELQLDREALVFRQLGVSLRPTLPKQQGEVIKALRLLQKANGGKSVAISDWQRRCVSVEGIPRRTFFEGKKALLRAGFVEEQEHGRFVAL
jgi:hypothetical protein